MCMEKFGVHFLTGEYVKGRATVEQLKADSLQEEINARTQRIEDLDREEERVRKPSFRKKDKIKVDVKEYLDLIDEAREGRNMKYSEGMMNEAILKYREKERAYNRKRRELEEEIQRRVERDLSIERELMRMHEERLNSREETVRDREKSVTDREDTVDRKEARLDDLVQELRQTAREYFPEEEVDRLFPERSRSRGHSR